MSESSERQKRLHSEIHSYKVQLSERLRKKKISDDATNQQELTVVDSAQSVNVDQPPVDPRPRLIRDAKLECERLFNELFETLPEHMTQQEFHRLLNAHLSLECEIAEVEINKIHLLTMLRNLSSPKGDNQKPLYHDALSAIEYFEDQIAKINAKNFSNERKGQIVYLIECKLERVLDSFFEE